MHNTIQELRGNVRVFARVRPFLPGDGGDNEHNEASVIPTGTNSLKLVWTLKFASSLYLIPSSALIIYTLFSF